MTSVSSARTFDVRHVQLARAAFAALAAIMITFSPDHSALVGMSVFSGFAIATGLVLLLWFAFKARRELLRSWRQAHLLTGRKPTPRNARIGRTRPQRAAG